MYCCVYRMAQGIVLESKPKQQKYIFWILCITSTCGSTIQMVSRTFNNNPDPLKFFHMFIKWSKTSPNTFKTFGHLYLLLKQSHPKTSSFGHNLLCGVLFFVFTLSNFNYSKAGVFKTFPFPRSHKFVFNLKKMGYEKLWQQTFCTL